MKKIVNCLEAIGKLTDYLLEKVQKQRA